MNFTEKENYNFNDLVEIVKILRAPDGCPWDREQTHKSIRSNFIEETYEAVEAIDTDDLDLLKKNSVMFFCRLLCMRKSKVNREHLI